MSHQVRENAPRYVCLCCNDKPAEMKTKAAAFYAAVTGGMETLSRLRDRHQTVIFVVLY